MKHLVTLAALSFLCLTATAQKSEKYARARISLDPKHTISGLARLGLPVDHGEHKRNTFFTSDFSATELQLARNAGYKVDVVINDVQKHYREQNTKTAAKTTATPCGNAPHVTVPARFHLGTYAGYFTYTEFLQIIDSMRLLYPGLISAKQPISTFTTHEGRPIYWLRISNNPDVDQPLKPQMLTTSVHHAREPGGLSATIFYMWYLLENYATDPRVKAIVDNSELYFVPMVNPDGYLQNIATDPSGGGMWRKNKRDNLDGSFGVDLNRNYGHTWAYDDFGSSPVTTSQTYRGTSAFSEPETQAIKWLAENHNFSFNLNFHTYNNALIYPWGHIYSTLTPDSAEFSAYGAHITEDNNYRYGTCDQTLSYVSNGDSDDWMYGEQTSKNKIFAFTPEIGDDDDGFYAPIANIQPDCEKNVSTNLHTAELMLTYAHLTPTDDKILIAPSGYLHYDLQRLGLQSGATYTVSIQSLDSRLTVPSTPKNYIGLALLQQVADSFSYSISASTPNGQLLRYVLATNNGYYDIRDTVSFYYGKKHNITTPSSSSFTGWTNSGWSLCTSHYISAPTSMKSSIDCDNYPDNAIASLTLNTPIDLTYSTEAWLRFYARWGIESKYDFAAVYAASVGSGAWVPLCGMYTRPGTSDQLMDEPIYDAQRPEWVKEHMDLNNFLGQKIQLRFEMKSDAGANYDGFYIDDIEIRSVQDTVTGTANLSLGAPVVNVYPNPATNSLHVSANTPGTPIHGTLFDVTGRNVLHFESTQESTLLNTGKLPAGIYVLKVYANDVALPVRKIVISK